MQTGLDCTIQLHTDGLWRDVASVSLHDAPQLGWRTSTYSGYGVEWAFEHAGKRDANALCCQWPVSLEPLQAAHWPVFLIDLLPQGFGRQELLRRLGLSAAAGAPADWSLLLAGAGNPIGHLRVKEAALWLAGQPDTRHGFTDDEVAQRGDAFAEHLATHGLFVAGSSGVQGEWPKILMTRAHDGLLYLDHALPDAEAAEHYIVKFARGTDPALARILHHEAPYMAVAAHLGLRVHAPLVLRERALFIPRFDRRRLPNGQLLRLAQESIATLTQMPGFEQVPSHEQVVRELLRRCTDPAAEVLEYVKRDIANLALGNKDNHARNTALQRDFNGHIALTPLYDFAPMYLHPDGIARRIRWECGDGGKPAWQHVIACIVAMAEEVHREERRPDPCPITHSMLTSGLRELAPRLQEVAQHGQDMGLEPAVLAHLKPGIEAQRLALEHLH